ncbi:uncharacterized protein MEPE_02127 [Melanopsichium pennsylvanicum]|uniref:SUN domain-containing protein n=2 Tax=Melanopsichium pennsylvanicum TaxID=63383 RepID=A0AAJ4XJ06_9BASI|nr:putative protein [Melanopsichium pennsylvanicum 4]SNX83420.1 uncharacterized protein MEPE_02127 [Melanopsichium pennsylvanicum]
MSSRSIRREAVRRSPRISGRSETPDARSLALASTPSRTRAPSPDMIDQQLTPSAASPRIRSPPLYNLSRNLAATSIKQEESISSSFYIREPSNSSRMTSPAPTYQPAILRGDQRSFHDPREAANASLSTSLSIFSSEGDPNDNYQNEEREVAQFQQQQEEATNASSRLNGVRRVSGQRKARTSLEDRPYRPGSDVDEDDDDIGSPTRRRRRRGRGRDSDSLGAFEQGRIANATWMAAASKKSRGRKSGYAVRASEEVNNDEHGVQINHDEEDAGATSGKETRFDGASDSDDNHADIASNFFIDKDESRLVEQPKPLSVIKGFFSGIAKLLSSVVFWLLTKLIRLPKRAWNSLGRDASKSLLNSLIFAIGAVVFSYLLQILLDSPSGLSARLTFLTPAHDDDVPGNPSRSSLVLGLDRENQRLRSELERLNSRLDTLSSSIESQISSSLTSASAKIAADTSERQTSELDRIQASTKRTISRMAQQELQSIQDSVSSSVELMLRDLDSKVNSRLKQRADETENKFLNRLEKEVSRIAKYANDQVNVRLGQAFDETFLSSVIENRLERYSRDRTGKVDWASVTSGAWLVEQGTVHKGFRYNSVWDVAKFLAQGRKVAIGDPVKAITPGAELGRGDCWMTGWGSMLHVKLAETKVVDELVVEHALPGMARTAPRRIMVWGYVDDEDEKYYLEYRKSKAQTQDEYLKQLMPEPFYNAIPHEYKENEEGGAPLLLGFFEFKPSGSTLQTFNLTQEARAYAYGVKSVRWQFVDGWSTSPPICVYRIRVHGSDWRVIGDNWP